MEAVNQELAGLEQARQRQKQESDAKQNPTSVAQKLADNLYNYVMSFGMQKDASGMSYIPVKVFEVHGMFIGTSFKTDMVSYRTGIITQYAKFKTANSKLILLENVDSSDGG